MKILDEFKTFIAKGNVVQLAVAVIIGASFNEIIKSVQEHLISPLIGFLGGMPDFSWATLELGQDANGKAKGVIKYGSFLNTVISFLITAAIVFFIIVKPMNKLTARLEKKQPPAPEGPKPATLDDVVAAIKDLKTPPSAAPSPRI
jgi:large conductance mechanosensitive channel